MGGVDGGIGDGGGVGGSGVDGGSAGGKGDGGGGKRSPEHLGIAVLELGLWPCEGLGTIISRPVAALNSNGVGGGAGGGGGGGGEGAAPCSP